ncbi:Uncharacterized protein TCM_038807 [Theobroma cacao]|uniref:Uncharacterized protein n=1 Tax=Theobroma cacao TaxID=3641 RepID=A0A061GXA5_THECC|nr:Uncharacterized protein TCM_038807 [Theobroma cacao]
MSGARCLVTMFVPQGLCHLCENTPGDVDCQEITPIDDFDFSLAASALSMICFSATNFGPVHDLIFHSLATEHDLFMSKRGPLIDLIHVSPTICDANDDFWEDDIPSYLVNLGMIIFPYI